MTRPQLEHQRMLRRVATKIALEISLHEASDGPVILAAAAELLKFINATLRNPPVHDIELK
jgi:hypothetical protein